MSDAFADLWNNSAPKKLPPTSVRNRQDTLTPSTPNYRPSKPSSSDAFDDLLGHSFTKSTSLSQMTIAERAKQFENQKMQSRAATPTTVTPAWDGLDALANPPPRPTPDAFPLEDDWGFGLTLSQPARPSSSLRPPALLDDDIHDDILGELGRPIESIHSVRSSFLHRTPPIIQTSHLSE